MTGLRLGRRTVQLGRRRKTTSSIVVLLLLISLIVGRAALRPPDWGSDALFYEAQRLELSGEGREEALRIVFSRPEAREVAAIEDEPSGVARVLDPAWVTYSSRFFRRRWTVPVLGAAVAPIFGDRSLEAVGFLGYLLLGPVLLLLLRRRFCHSVSLLAAAICTLAPPVAKWSTHIGIDSWGLVLTTASYLAFDLVRQRGMRWLALWVSSMFVMAFTRDTALVVGLALAWVTLRELKVPQATRRNLILLLTGGLAALPAPLVFSAPLRDNLTYTIGDSAIPTDTSWGYIASNMPSQVWHVLRADWAEPWSQAPPLALAAELAFGLVLATLFVLVVKSPREDAYFRIQRASLITGTIYLLLSPNPTNYRLELVFLPAVAVAVALALELLLRWCTRQASPDGTPASAWRTLN